ncbi:MAG: 2-amino-4-hydroxy-6-hydroxymethyldihydropteridine diphosphokinase [Parvularculaceae bacterium]
MILIGFGSNLPFRGAAPAAIVGAALRAVDDAFGVARVSRLYGSPAWPDPSAPAYVNAAASLASAPEPLTLMAGLLAIERAFGRRRGVANAPRTLDLDLLDHDGQVLDHAGPPRLVLPHPRLHERDFALAPLIDVAPDWVHPTLGRTGAELLDALAARSARPLSAGA